MQTLEITLPDDVALRPQELKRILAARLYEMGRLSLGQAAEVAELPKRAFLEALGPLGASFFNDAPETIADDVRNA